MQLWTLDARHLSWSPHKEFLIGLATVSRREFRGEVLLTTTRPAREAESICAALCLIRTARNDDLPVHVGTPHPTRDLVARLREAGATEIWAVNLAYHGVAPHLRLDLDDRLEATTDACPALRLHPSDPIELSVCAKRANRRVLVMATFRAWCLADCHTCPYWRGEHVA